MKVKSYKENARIKEKWERKEEKKGNEECERWRWRARREKKEMERQKKVKDKNSKEEGGSLHHHKVEEKRVEKISIKRPNREIGSQKKTGGSIEENKG